jgi:pimeloyl-ACP methyl ester carboxylesterase
MDMTGYGRSTRPLVMNDPCNLAPKQQASLVPGLIPGECAPSYQGAMTTIASDWNDIGAVVDHVLALRHIDQISLIGWSLGGPRAGGYAAQHPEKVRNLVLLAPAYDRETAEQSPARSPAPGAAMNIQSREGLVALWNYQVGCPGQYDPAVSDVVWSAMTGSDPVGATWGSGVRRAPQVPNSGWTQSVVAKTTIPTLMVTGEQDKLVPSPQVRDLYADLGSKKKVIVELACSSHFAMWERNRLPLFRASLEWLTSGTVNGLEQGTLHLGN